MKKTLVLLLKIPFVFVPAFIIWLFFCAVVGLVLLVFLGVDGAASSSSENPFPSLKKTCQWVAEWYVNSAKYLAECVR